MSRLARWVVHPAVMSIFKIHDESPNKVSTSREAFDKIQQISREMMEGDRDRFSALGLMEDTLKSNLACGELTMVGVQYKRVQSRLMPKFLNLKARRLRKLRRQLRRERKLRIQRLNDFIRQAKPLEVVASPSLRDSLIPEA